MFIACSHLCKINKFYSVISHHDKVKLFSVFVGILPEYLGLNVLTRIACEQDLYTMCLQRFDAWGWAAEMASGL